MSAIGKYKCLCCKAEFTARVADRKRGWARYCSKSCKAKKQEQRTGQYAAYRDQSQYDRDMAAASHPMASGYFGHGQE